MGDGGANPLDSIGKHGRAEPAVFKISRAGSSVVKLVVVTGTS